MYGDAFRTGGSNLIDYGSIQKRGDKLERKVKANAASGGMT